IYLGLAAYALWQLSPTARRSTCQRLLRPWALPSALLNAAWIWSVQLDLLVVSVAVLMVLLAGLVRVVRILGAARAAGGLEALHTDGTFGLHLGWVTVRSLANVDAWRAAAGVALVTETPLGLVGVLLAAGMGFATALLGLGRIAPALATSWGLVWIAVGRTEGAFESTVLVWTATFAAGGVLLVAVASRLGGVPMGPGRPG